MESIFQVIRQDIKTALIAFEDDNFDDMNIFANRSMANAIFGNHKKLILPGFFLKDIAIIYRDLKSRKEPTAFSTAKAVCSKYIKLLEEHIEDFSFDEKQLWEEFFKLFIDLREFRMNKYEYETHFEDLIFSRDAVKWLIEFLGNNREVLLELHSLLLRGIINEMDRIIRVHSGDLIEIYALSLITALDRFYAYFRIAYVAEEGIDKETLKKTLFSYIEKIQSLLTGSEVQVSDVMIVLWDLVKDWREFFIRYMESLAPRPVKVDKEIEISEETKKILTEGVTKALERDIETKK